MKSEPQSLVLRGLLAFADVDHVRPQVQALGFQFHEAWDRFIARHRERVALLDAFWLSDDPQLLGVLLPRLVWLVEEIDSAWQAMMAAVEVGEVVRTADLFVDPHHEPPLSVLRTFMSMNEGRLDVHALETPLSDRDREKIKAKRKPRIIE